VTESTIASGYLEIRIVDSQRLIVHVRAKLHSQRGETVLQSNPIFDYVLVAFFLLLLAFLLKWLVEAKLNQ